MNICNLLGESAIQSTPLGAHRSQFNAQGSAPAVSRRLLRLEDVFAVFHGLKNFVRSMRGHSGWRPGCAKLAADQPYHWPIKEPRKNSQTPMSIGFTPMIPTIGAQVALDAAAQCGTAPIGSQFEVQKCNRTPPASRSQPLISVL